MSNTQDDRTIDDLLAAIRAPDFAPRQWRTTNSQGSASQPVPLMEVSISHDMSSCAPGGTPSASENGETAKHKHLIKLWRRSNGLVSLSNEDHELLAGAWAGDDIHPYNATIAFTLGDRWLESAGGESNYQLDPVIVYSIKNQMPGTVNCTACRTVVLDADEGDAIALAEAELANKFLKGSELSQDVMLSWPDDSAANVASKALSTLQSAWTDLFEKVLRGSENEPVFRRMIDEDADI